MATPALRPTRLIASLILGVLTTLGAAWGLALWLPIQYGRGTVALDGDHLQPWLLELHRPGASRTIYFEKGRIWSKLGIGPPGGSSSAVACWSFATATRSNPRFVRGEVVIPESLKAEMARTYQPRVNSAVVPTAWGVAEDSRGWPLPAFSCTFIGTTAPDSLYTYLVKDGVRREPAVGVYESLADIRALPVRPVWRGLVVDGAIATAGWWVVLTLAGMGAAAVMSRIRKPGHCPKCNYDLKGDLIAGCPECGWNRPSTSAAVSQHLPTRLITLPRASRLCTGIATCILLGSLTSITIAWILAAWLSLDGSTGRFCYFANSPERNASASAIELEKPGLWRRAYDIDRWGADKLSLVNGLLESVRVSPQAPLGFAVGAASDRLPLPETDPADESSWEGLQDARGWPFLCMRCDFHRTVSKPGAQTMVQSPGGIILTPMLPPQSDLAKARALPLRPLWKGLILNTALFGLLWALPLASAPRVRRRIRARRGHCPKCRYDLKGDLDSGCPECGWNKKIEPATTTLDRA